MPFRSYVIIGLCLIITGVGSVGMSWTYGPHKSLEAQIEEVLSNDSDPISLSRNFSPYCALGTCPKVSATTRVQGGISDVDRDIKEALNRRQYSSVDGGGKWTPYQLGDLYVRYWVERIDTQTVLVHWESGGGRAPLE
jgi:hypothetical protein